MDIENLPPIFYYFESKEKFDKIREGVWFMFDHYFEFEQLITHIEESIPDTDPSKYKDIDLYVSEANIAIGY